MSQTNSKGTIAIDFDGVIHKYSNGWQDGNIYDEPFDDAFESIKYLMDKGYCVFILSTRKPKQIKEWLNNYLWNREYWIFNHIPPFNKGNDYVMSEILKYGFTCKIIPFWKKFWDEKYVLGITNRKLPAKFYIDDRVIKFDGDWKKCLTKIIKK